MNVTIITGASSGIGREFALQLDEKFHKMDEIWLIARRREKLQKLADSLHTKSRVISLDVTDKESLKQFRELLALAKPKIRILVNGAGLGLMGPFTDIPLEEQLSMLHLNCEALTEMTYICLPYMGKSSRLIQLASSAAFLPQKNFAVYAATKAYVLSLSRALGEELKERGILVTAVCPGPVDTEFFDIAEKYGTTLAVKKLTLVTAKRVVKDAVRDTAKGRPVSVCSLPIKAFHVLSKVFPDSFLFFVMRAFK